MGIFCFQCEQVFSTQSNLNKHRRLVHNTKDFEGIAYKNDVGMFKCLDGCEISFKYYSDLRKHLEKSHGIVTEVLNEKFDTFDGKWVVLSIHNSTLHTYLYIIITYLNETDFLEFETWLRVEEQTNEVRYQKSTGTKRICDTNGKISEKYFYNCTRSGK